MVGAGVDPDGAVASGLVHRVKLNGRWLYLSSAIELEAALEEAQAGVEACLEDWLLGHNPYLAGAAIKRAPSLSIGRSGLDVLLRELARRGRLGTLAVLNATYEPYLAFFRLDDAAEVARQLGRLVDVLSSRGWVSRRDLLAPERPVPRRAWRDVVLRHGEWQGLGFIDDEGDLVAWD
jgi:hypothetical protein